MLAYNTSRQVEQLSREIREFKGQMKDFKDTMLKFEEENDHTMTYVGQNQLPQIASRV